MRKGSRLLLPAALIALAAFGCKKAPEVVEPPTQKTPAAAKTPVPAKTPTPTPTPAVKPTATPAAATPRAEAGPNPVVVITTSLGEIAVELDVARAPITTKNFLDYVEAKFYDGTVFHRVISNFMIQGGGFTADLNEKPTRPPIRNEASNGLTNKCGTIAMARTSDPHSATSQFFINVKDNPGLDAAVRPPGYAVFGSVVSGMDVVDKIRAVPTHTAATPTGMMMRDVPAEPVVIQSVRVKQ